MTAVRVPGGSMRTTVVVLAGVALDVDVPLEAFRGARATHGPTTR